MHLSGIYIYPVKSLRGVAVPAATLDAHGLVGDRRFLVVDDTGRFLTQRVLPRMALIDTELGREELILRHPQHGSAAVGLADDGPPATVQIWRDTVQAVDCGVEIAVWLSDFLRHPCRLVRMGADYRRPVKPAKAQPGDVVTFADAYPLLALSEASLADLNDRLVTQDEEPVPMNRFRPNVVIAGCPAFAEDAWQRVRIGAAVFRAAGPCVRCSIPTIDQATAVRYKEPIRTLAAYRRTAADASEVIFGQNLIHETKSGEIRIGDAVAPLE